jgi:hypothetical protein
MRKEVQELVNMGPLPDCETVAEEQLKMYESLLSRVTPPISNDEARGAWCISSVRMTAMVWLGPYYI